MGSTPGKKRSANARLTTTTAGVFAQSVSAIVRPRIKVAPTVRKKSGVMT